MEDVLQGQPVAVLGLEGRGGGMDYHLDGSHRGDTGHIRWLDGSWEKGERGKKRKRPEPASSV